MRKTTPEYHAAQSEQFMRLFNELTPAFMLSQRAIIELSANVSLVEFLKGHTQMLSLIAHYHRSKGNSAIESDMLAERAWRSCRSSRGSMTRWIWRERFS